MEVPPEQIRDAEDEARRIRRRFRAVNLPDPDVDVLFIEAIEAGNGNNNNQQELNGNVRRTIVMKHGIESSKLWQAMPFIVLMSNLIFWSVMKTLGIDARNSFLLGASYNTYFHFLQWILLIVIYYIKRYKTRTFLRIN